MIGRAVRRFLLAAFTLLLATTLLYLAIRMVPGTPWGDDPATPAARIEEWTTRYHLDKGFADGYLRWVLAILRGDLGESYVVARGERVAALIAGRLPVSLALGLLGFCSALTAATLLAFAAARRPGGSLDHLGSALLYALHAAPTFWIAMLLQDLLALRLGWLPALGSGPAEASLKAGMPAILARIPYWILPPACLALGSLAFLFRFTRASLLDGVRSPHVRAARARGIPEPILLRRHAFSATRIDLVTLLGTLAPAVISGSIIIEKIFALPGLGQLFFLAAGGRDYPVVMGVGLVLAIVSVIGSALADLLYLAVEPRLRGRARAGAHP